jgi:hypothetical protein
MTSNALILSKNPAVVEWLRDKGIVAPVLEHATPLDVAHKHVYGTVPYWLAAFTDCISEVNLPCLDRPSRDRFLRGDITIQEMDAAGAELVTYRVRTI